MYYYYYYNRIMALCPGLPRWASTRTNIHLLTYADHHPTFIIFFHLLQSIASSLFNLRAWQSFLYNLSPSSLWSIPLGLEPSTSYSIYFFTQSVSSFRNKCSYHHSLFCCTIWPFSSLLAFKCHLLFFPDRPGLTSMYATSHTTAVQPPSLNQWHIPTG